jgi:hypothetical protein
MKITKAKNLLSLSALALGVAIAAPASAQNFDHLKCFKIKDTKTFKKATADLTVTGGPFAGMQNCTISAGSKEFCVPVHKMNVVVTEGTEAPTSGQEHLYDRLCYKVKCPAGGASNASYADQFGTHALGGFKVSTICTPTVIGEVPTEAPPTWPATPQDYVFGPSSYMNTLTVPTVTDDVPSCCKDFGAISRDKIEDNTNNVDNALAVLADQLAGLTIDVQQALDDAIAAGELVILLDHPGLDIVTQPDAFTLVQLLGAFEGATDFTAANAGTGTFLANASSFEGGTGEPLNWFSPAQMGTTDMSAGPFKLSIALPFGFLSVTVSAAQADVVADHGAITVGGVPYTNGELSGYVLMDELFDNLNAILNAPTCACLGLTEDVYQKQVGGTWTSSCISNAASLCSDPGEEVCAILAGDNLLGSPPQVCAALPDILQQQADIDLNSEPSVYEAMSVGLQFTAVNGQIVGINP